MNITDLKKNDEMTILIDDIGNNGEGIGHVDGYALFVKDALPGETVRVRLMKCKKNYGFARLLSIIEPSPDRIQPVCPVASRCGGCTLQHLSYEAQLAYKEKKIKDCLIRLGGIDPDTVEWQSILGMDEENFLHYRNKAQFPVRRGLDGKAVAGFYARRSHDVIPVTDCAIQHPMIHNVLSLVMSFIEDYEIKPYDEDRHKGLVRHVYIRRAYTTGQIMVCLVINGNSLPHSDALISSLQQVDGLTSVCLNVNREKTNVILGKKMIYLFGPSYIEDCIGDIRYHISPQSFYQVNPVQTRRLYETVLSFADLSGNEKVWDLYCGIGTISLFLAKKAGYVFGVEIVPEAIENAKENARLNGITNVTFHCGAAEDAAGEQGVDVIVVDPPRKGCDEALIETMVSMAPEKIVYVSCDPATLARDVKRLGECGYGVRKVRGCDMFPMGGHVETVVGLQRRDI